MFNEETKESLQGYERGQETELGAVNVMTGIYTGRSPKDKFIVDDENSHDTVWWDSEEYHNDNHRASKEAWTVVKDIAKKELSNKRLFVVDGFCGTHKDTRMKIRFIVEVAWQAHFVTNMFIRPKSEADFEQEPDFIVYNASKAKVENWKELGLHSETCVMFNVTTKEQVIVNTWYGGEMKKGMFSMMNYFLPFDSIPFDSISFDSIPCYNSAAYMDTCIESIMACVDERDDIEIIIVDKAPDAAAAVKDNGPNSAVYALSINDRKMGVQTGDAWPKGRLDQMYDAAYDELASDEYGASALALADAALGNSPASDSSDSSGLAWLGGGAAAAVL